MPIESVHTGLYWGLLALSQMQRSQATQTPQQSIGCIYSQTERERWRVWQGAIAGGGGELPDVGTEIHYTSKEVFDAANLRRI